MKFKVSLINPFIEEFLIRGPKKLALSWSEKIKPFLEERGDIVDGSSIKKLKQYKNAYRYRSGDYRLVYIVDFQSKIIKMIGFGDRKDIYGPEKLNSIISRDQIPIELIENLESPIYLQKSATKEEEINSVKYAYDEKEEANFIDSITKENLIKWSIPKKLHTIILECKNDNEILKLQKRIPEEDYENLFYQGKPPEDIIKRSKFKARIIPDEQTRAIIAKEIKLSDIRETLFVLDHQQNEIVDRFVKTKKGTWLIKGPAGSGKSVVLISCAKAIVDSYQRDVEGSAYETKKILYTTYTNSLKATTESYLKGYPTIDVQSAWSICLAILKWDCKNKEIDYVSPSRGLKLKSRIMQRIYSKSLAYAEGYCDPDNIFDPSILVRRSTFSKSKNLKNEDYQDGSMNALEFLHQELMEVIWARNLSLDEYLHKDSRLGRLKRGSRRLTSEKKRLVWKFGQILDKELKKEKIFLWDPRRFTEAKKILDLNPECPFRYDYIFFDEAQSLPPLAVDMLLSATKNNNLLIAADESQDLYNSGFSQKFIPKDRKIVILKKQFRSTKEIEKAVQGILRTSETKDSETYSNKRVLSSMKSGKMPEFYIYNYKENKKAGSLLIQEARKIYNFLKEAADEEGLTPRDAVVIVPNSLVGQGLMNVINGHVDSYLNAKFFQSRDFDPNHPGLTITNAYSLQGIEFPIVIVVKFHIYPTTKSSNVIMGKLPSYITENLEEMLENEKRMFFVSCSRAMTRLLVTSNMGCSKINNEGYILEYKPDNYETYLESGSGQNSMYISKPDSRHIKFFTDVIDTEAWNFTKETVLPNETDDSEEEIAPNDVTRTVAKVTIRRKKAAEVKPELEEKEVSNDPIEAENLLEAVSNESSEPIKVEDKQAEAQLLEEEKIKEKVEENISFQSNLDHVCHECDSTYKIYDIEFQSNQIEPELEEKWKINFNESIGDAKKKNCKVCLAKEFKYLESMLVCTSCRNDFANPKTKFPQKDKISGLSKVCDSCIHRLISENEFESSDNLSEFDTASSVIPMDVEDLDSDELMDKSSGGTYGDEDKGFT